MSKSLEAYKEELASLIKREEAFLKKTEQLKEDLGHLSSEKEKKEIIRLLKMAEEIYIESKVMSSYVKDFYVDEDPIGELLPLCTMEVVSDSSYKFILPPLRSVRKRDEGSGLGAAIKNSIASLLLDYQKQNGRIKTLNNPTVYFVHLVSDLDAARNSIPDPDNLDVSKVIDGLQSGFLIKNDNLIEITLVQEGRIVDDSESKTVLFVYENEWEE